jgi:hypothetical protein
VAFPQTPLAVIVEMLLGGVWTDVTQWVYIRNPITIERGRKDEGSRVDPGQCTLTLNNRDGRWSSRKPDGPYYGLIGRNTQVRVSVDAGASYLATTGTVGGTTGASTPDAAALDITGDIDVRFEATLDNWLDSGSVELCGKGAVTGNQRSWLLLMRDRKLHWEWSTAGTSTIQKDSTVELPVPPSGRIAVRVTQDVNDGAGNNVVTFYTAPTIAGPWTQLGNPVTTAGTTSIFNSSAALRVGDGWSDLSFASSSGAVHAFELRNGIAGSVVANPDFTIQTPGGTSFADGTGKTWTVGSATSISNRKTRFNGEISEWPVRWDVSGKDIEVSVQAAGILRRIGQGNAPLTASLQRHIVANGALECWPLTDGTQATRGASLFGGSPMAPRLLAGTAPVQWAEGKLADWIDPVVQLPAATDGYIPGTAPASTAAASGWSADLSLSGIKSGDVDFTIADRGAGSDADPRFIWYLATNRASNQVLLYCSSISESSSTSPLLATISTAGIYDTNPHHIRLTVVPGGSTTTYTVYLDGVSRATGSHSVVTKAARMLRPGWFLNGASDSTTAIGYVTYWGPTAPTAASTYAALIGNQGEAAAVRAERLCGEAGIEFRPSGVPEDTTPLGPQLQETFLEVLQNAATSDSGAVYEDRTDVALRFRDRNGLYNQAVTLALNYAADGEVAPPLEPVDDDQATRNDVTVTREGGSSGRAVLETGKLSVQAPPNGVGTYDEAVTLSLYTDDQPVQHASWRVHLGTWDEARYPVVHVDLAAAPHLIDTATAVDIGDRLTISNPPVWLPPDLIDLLAQGYTEVLGHPNGWDLRFNCTPAGPWTVVVVGNSFRLDTAGCVTNGSTSSSSSVLNVNTDVGKTRWADSATYPSEYPFDLYVGGEVMRATSCTGTALSQTFAVTRSINGVVKAHASGTDVRLATPPIIPL